MPSLASKILDLFVTRTDTYSIQLETGGYRRINKKVTESLIEKHLKGEITVGLYQIDPLTNIVRWIVIDIDPEHHEYPEKLAIKLLEKARELFPPEAVWLEASRYPDPSFHLWIFLEPLPAVAARWLGRRLLEKTGIFNVELFPKQDKIEPTRFGNLVKLPYGLHQETKKWSCILDPKSLKPIKLEEFLNRVKPCSFSKQDIKKILAMVEEQQKGWFKGAYKNEKYTGHDPPCIQYLLRGVKEGRRNETAIRLASYWLNFRKIKRKEAWRLIVEWNNRNQPPLSEDELKTVFNSAIKGNYVYGCSDEILKSYCPNTNQCPLFKKHMQIKMGDSEIELLFKSPVTKINPAIGICSIDQEMEAYVNVWLPARIRNEKSNTSECELPFLILSNKKVLLADEKCLKKYGLALSHKPLRIPNRWSLESIEQFLSSDANVNPYEVFTSIKRKIEEYVEFPDQRYYDLLAIWIIGTYFHHLFNSYPYLYVGGVKASGKTKVLTLTYCLAFNSIFSNNMTTSVIYRLIQNARSTLLIDETEKLSDPDRAHEFRSILLSGYKPGPLVYRTERSTKDKLVPQGFEVYAPKMLANIRGLEDVLEDRCITITMKRAKNKEIKNREISLNDPVWQKLRDDLYLIYLVYWREVKEIYEHLNSLEEFSELGELVEILKENFDKLSGRDLELWKPLFAIAIFLKRHEYVSQQTHQTQQNLLDILFQLAEEHRKERHIENMTETGEYILVQTLLDLVKNDDYYRVSEIKQRMSENFEEEQKWLTNKWIGRAFKRLGIKDKRLVGGRTEYRLTKDIIKDLAERFGIPIESEKETQKWKSPLNKNSPVFIWKQIKPAEPCELCGKAPVEYEVTDFIGGTVLRRCKNCFNEMRRKFANAEWRYYVENDPAVQILTTEVVKHD